MNGKSLSRSQRPKSKPIVKNNGKKYNGNRNNSGRNIRHDTAVNEYYLDIAFKLKAAKLILLFLLFVFIIAGALLNSSELTIENLNYLLRYIDIQGSEKSQVSEFPIDADEDSYVGYYKNNIVVLKKNKLDVYDLNGRRNFSHSLTYSNPVIETSQKYILTYDKGANKMQVFNSFSKLYEYKDEYNQTRPIYMAKITDKGNIVYVTTAKGYKSAVKVMNSSFKEIYGCKFGDKYIFDADIDNDAKKLLIAAVTAENGDFMSRLLLYDTTSKSEEYEKEIDVRGELPLGVKLNKEGFFSIFENSLKIFNSNYDKVEDYNFAYRGIEAFEFTSDYAAVILNEKSLRSENSILIFDCSGDLIYSEIINADIIDMRFSESSENSILYFLTRTGLYKIDIQEKQFELVTEAYDETSRKIIHVDDENIFISGLVKVNIIELDNQK